MVSSRGRRYALAIGSGTCVFALGVALSSWRAAEGGWMLVFADAFTLAATAMLSVSALLWVSRSGFFDLFLYGTRRLVGLVIPPLGINRESFYDYRARRVGRARVSPLPTALVGAAFFAVSVALCLLVGA